MTPYYSDAAVTIYHGDCREVIERIKGDALVTDPPYGVEFVGKRTKRLDPNGGYDTGDSTIGPEVVAGYLPFVKRAAVFTGTRIMHLYPAPADMGCVYCPSGAGRGPWGFACFNPILFYGTNPTNHLGQKPASIISSAKAGASEHPCPKPLEWMTWLVSLASLEAETVIDPFMGSGTTLRAAKDLGRRAVGIEISERYCEIAAKRMAQEVFDFGTAV